MCLQSAEDNEKEKPGQHKENRREWYPKNHLYKYKRHIIFQKGLYIHFGLNNFSFWKQFHTQTHTPYPASIYAGGWLTVPAAVAAKLLQSCPTLCDSIDGSPPGSPIPEILQARTLEWVAISSPICMKVKSESEVAQLCLTRSDPMDYSPPGSSVHGIFQARVLEWGAIAFSVLHLRFRQILFREWPANQCGFTRLENGSNNMFVHFSLRKESKRIIFVNPPTRISVVINPSQKQLRLFSRKRESESTEILQSSVSTCLTRTRMWALSRWVPGCCRKLWDWAYPNRVVSSALLWSTHAPQWWMPVSVTKTKSLPS